MLKGSFTDEMCALERFTTARKWEIERKKEFTISAKAYAQSLHQSLVQRYGNVTTSQLSCILKVNIVSQTDSEASRQYVHFADYDPKLQTILVNEVFVERVVQCIARYSLIPLVSMPTSFRDVVIAHELFHFLENPDRQWAKRYLPSWCKRNHVTGRVGFVQQTMASEVAAMHFSKLQTKITFSPCVFEQLLVQLISNGV
ncbi:MAG: hypothetical protein OWR52_08000 [Acidibacillus sp.]|nr:hypothetical protein [Acidibacillus sp.]